MSVEFEAIAERVRSMKLTYLGKDKLTEIGACLTSLKQIDVEGDFLEFGLALGGSGICIASELDGVRSFWGLDVFGMIPPPGEHDGPVPLNRYHVIKSGKSSGIGGDPYYGYVRDLKDVVISNFDKFGLSAIGGRINFIEGLYQDTLKTLPDTMKIAFCHIDCDWYQSVLLCLEYVVPRLSSGGIVILDDYNDWEGCKKATDEFCREHGEVWMVRTQPHAVLVKIF